MYHGVKNHHILPNVTDYESAQRALAIWTSKSRRGRQIAQVHDRGEGRIAFQFWTTDVVTWCPDGSVEIDNYGSKTTTEFAENFLPDGIRLHYPSNRKGATGGSNIISFRTHLDRPDLTWEDLFHVCQGSVVRFVPQDGVHRPDPDTCYDITLPMGVDRKALRDVAKKYHFREFESWLSVAPTHLEAAGNTVEHMGWEPDICMDALEKRDFRAAAESLPPIKVTNAFGIEFKPLPISMQRWGEYVSMTSFAKLKMAIWDFEGLIREETRKTWPESEFRRRMAKVHEMSKLGLGTRHLGPRT
jgi:hypothetical protein